MKKQLEASKVRVAELEAKVARLEAEMASTKPGDPNLLSARLHRHIHVLIAWEP